MPVWGADPDKITDSWWEDWQDDGQGGKPLSPGERTYVRSPKVRRLVSHFAYHPRMRLSQRFNEEDQSILISWIARSMRAGYDEPQIKQAIDRFFMSWGREYDTPVHGITMTEMQARIFEGQRTHHGDPYIDWIVSGMPDEGPFDDPRGVRSLLLLRTHEGALRYPDVVVQILRYSGTLRYKEKLLTALEYIIAYNLGKEDNRPELYRCQEMLENYNVPDELLSPMRSKLRPQSASMVEALVKQESKRGKRTD